MSHVLNSSTSRSSAHGSFIVVTPGNASGSPLPLTRSSNVWRFPRAGGDDPGAFMSVAVVGVPIQPMTSGAPAARGVRRGTHTLVSTQVGSTVSDVLYLRA